MLYKYDIFVVMRFSQFTMTGTRIAILFCIIFVQRAAVQAACQSDLYVSLDDVLRAVGANGANQLTQPCGCGQSSLPIINPPCGCGQSGLSLVNQPGLSLGQNCGCGGQFLPSLSIGQPSLGLFGQQSCGCNQPLPIGQPGISIGQNSLGCGGPLLSSLSIGQPGISLGQSCGCGQSRPINGGVGCGCQVPSLGNQLSIGQCGLGLGNLQTLAIQPSLSLNSLQAPFNQPCLSNAALQNGVLGPVGGIANVVPSAVLQAPSYGIFFTGENLIIEGAVQVCGSMPFTSAVEVAGALPALGSGYVQYVCNDIC